MRAKNWNPYLKGDIDKLERIQNRGIRFIKKDYRSRRPGSITTMKQQLELETLEERRHNLRLINIFVSIETEKKPTNQRTKLSIYILDTIESESTTRFKNRSSDRMMTSN
jgi:hypothetical protein